MDHPEVIFRRFGRDNLEGDFLQIISEEYNSLVDSRRHRPTKPLDELDTAVLDDVE